MGKCNRPKPYTAVISDEAEDGYSERDDMPSAVIFYHPFEILENWYVPGKKAIAFMGDGFFHKGASEKIVITARGKFARPSEYSPVVIIKTKDLLSTERQAIDAYFRQVEETFIRLDNAIEKAVGQ